MRYRCQFPHCSYIVTSRSLIDSHHIVPKCNDGENQGRNRLLLCPEHHRLVYIPGVERGQHAIKHDKSIVLKGMVDSNFRPVLSYYKCSDEVPRYYNYDKKVDIILEEELQTDLFR